MTASKYITRLFHQGQAAFRSDWQSRITQDSLVVFGGQLAQLAIGLVSSALFAQALGPADFSVFSVVGAIMMIMVTVADLGLNNSAVRFVVGAEPSSHNTTVSVYGRLKMMSGLITAVFMFLLAEPITTFANLAQSYGSHLVKIAAFGVLAVSLGNITATLLHSSRRFRRTTVTALTNSFITLTLVGILFWQRSLTLIPALWVGIIAACGAALCGYVLIPPAWRQSLHRVGMWQSQEAKKLLTFGKWLWVSSIFTILVARLDLLLLNWWLPPETVGIYALASNLALKAAIINQTLHLVLLPVASAITGKRAYRDYVQRSLIRSFILCVCMVAVLPLAAPFIVKVYGIAYVSATPIFYLLMIVILLDLFTGPLVLLAYPMNMPRLLAASEGARALLLLGIGFIVIPVWGIYGAILAKIIAKLGGILIAGFRIRMQYRTLSEANASL